MSVAEPVMSMPVVLVAAGVTWLVSVLLVLTKRWHGHFSLDSHDGAQKFHSDPTPRIGGVAILCGSIAAWWLEPALRGLLTPILAAGSLAFAAGLAEDITKRVGVMARLLATTGSALLACVVTGYWLTSVSVPGVDSLLLVAWFAVPFTAIALSGVANALNIIDGFNGLAAGVAIIILLTLGAMAAVAGDLELALLCLTFSGVMSGFLLVNFPLGRIFLGDGGAYFLGFAIGWTALLLVERNPSISPWAGMLACAYPVIEMFASMWRKHRREGHHPSQPDGLHFHMLIHRRIVRRLFPGAPPVQRNALTAPFAWAFAMIPAVLAYMFRESTLMLVVGFGLTAFIYSALYARLTQFRWCLSPLTLRRLPRVTG
jgi:UDP-N-acetylmuramyl pentapeptide phosphotransferase/UDP-N-acetylglucosamine-1-phosphate transferase